MTKRIPFNNPYITGKEIEYISQSILNKKLSGDGPFTQLCNNWLEDKLSAKKALLTHSCTAALEMAAILLDVKVGDEVIMPSFTFVSTANAFVLRGAVPVFVDIRPDTLNIDENKIEEAITNKTKAIVVVHYAGVACEMDTIMDISQKYQIPIIEDAAQGLLSSYKDKPLGTFGVMSTFSFHETKNFISGEGGALVINDLNLVERAEIIREKGTNRSKFFRGQIDKYTWVDVGSSYLPSELIAAFLWGQLQLAEESNKLRIEAWERYDTLLFSADNSYDFKRPYIPPNCKSNGHIYYLIFKNTKQRNYIMKNLSENYIDTVFHYIPLHLSPAGKKFGRIASDKLPITDHIYDRLLRLPISTSISATDQERIIELILEAL